MHNRTRLPSSRIVVILYAVRRMLKTAIRERKNRKQSTKGFKHIEFDGKSDIRSDCFDRKKISF